MSVILRFAPSPTGLLHVGNLRLAVINWLFVRQQGGSLILRLDDTDAERSEERYVEAVRRDLSWCGLSWDREERQSARTGRYDAVIAELKASGRLYPCYETPEELSLKRKSLLNQGKPPIYDRAALALSEQQRADHERAGRRPHWRFKLEHAPLEWHDLGVGPLHFHGADLSDPVVIREDGRPLYMLPSCIDDADFGVTHIVRGEDHIANSAVQLQIFEALGAPIPRFAHVPLLLDAQGDKLSKRLGSLSIEALREEQGIEPMALLSLMGRLGTSEAVEAEHGPDALIAGFDFAKISRNSPRFDEAELARLNARIVHELPYEAVADRVPGISEDFWYAVRANLAHVAEATEWWAVAQGPVAPLIDVEDGDFTRQAADLLPPEPYDAESWKTFVDAVKATSGRKGKALFMPLRKALTGRDHGPELAGLLPLIGRARAAARLRGETA